ncbi:MAG: hypothetical protein AB7E79_16510 [Rhodospirillaceae bacterium]
MPKVRNATKSANPSDEQRTASARKDAAFFAERRAREAANLKRTLELRAQRLAHQQDVKAQPVKARPKVK